ncbi:hypothetical protein F4861DRAFT_131115 [Xylaria intraflava]|nr:hypothetical protein F4861DRAFT_131115 [Xylaria intraflava]
MRGLFIFILSKFAFAPLPDCKRQCITPATLKKIQRTSMVSVFLFFSWLTGLLARIMWLARSVHSFLCVLLLTPHVLFWSFFFWLPRVELFWCLRSRGK